MILLPAYGRTYKSLPKTFEDWINGKDFKIYNGPYTSIRDLESLKQYDKIEVPCYDDNDVLKLVTLWENSIEKILTVT